MKEETNTIDKNIIAENRLKLAKRYLQICLKSQNFGI
jgi:hypothetical protein